MGTRFLFTTKTKAAGMSIQLKHKGLFLGKSHTRQINGMVMRARSMLSATIAGISSGPSSAFQNYANTYFCGPPTSGEWRDIMSVLELTYHGLGNDVTLKLGADGAHGFVVASVVSSTTPGAVIDKDGDYVTRDGHTLHVSKKSLLKSEELGVVTIIHEATHKYANTFDHDWAGYRKEDDSGWEASQPGDTFKGPMSKAQGLKNADSYAYFTYRAGASMGR